MDDDFKRAQSQAHRDCPGGFKCRLDAPDDKPAVRGRARAKLRADDHRQYKSFLDELVAINHEAVNSPQHREAMRNLPPSFTF